MPILSSEVFLRQYAERDLRYFYSSTWLQKSLVIDNQPSQISSFGINFMCHDSNASVFFKSVLSSRSSTLRYSLLGKELSATCNSDAHHVITGSRRRAGGFKDDTFFYLNTQLQLPPPWCYNGRVSGRHVIKIRWPTRAMYVHRHVTQGK